MTITSVGSVDARQVITNVDAGNEVCMLRSAQRRTSARSSERTRDDKGAAAGLDSTALQMAIGLAIGGTAVSIGLGGVAANEAAVDVVRQAVWPRQPHRHHRATRRRRDHRAPAARAIPTGLCGTRNSSAPGNR
ncbi:hypothetical protein GCM10023320_80750 [Pseudonocardia adelaidensis]|uniref:Uncharacterized protein n=1 Tax=Pseudonocardia adelaidensis TaxID=648754 RepID=A0ABP9P6Q0_9PSEU